MRRVKADLVDEFRGKPVGILLTRELGRVQATLV